MLHNSFIGSILKFFIQPLINIEKNIKRQLNLQKGLAWQDLELHSHQELGRNILFQHINRQCLHPYHWILKAKRRERYFKVEKGVPAFYVPEYIRSQAASQTQAECFKVRIEWWDFLYQNYVSDFTPTAKRTVVPKLIILELLVNYGVMDIDAYNRYFMNENDNLWASEKDLKIVKDRKKFPFNLTTADGKRKFEDYVNTVNRKTPGVVALEGQQFDFKKYYAEIGV